MRHLQWIVVASCAYLVSGEGMRPTLRADEQAGSQDAVSNAATPDITPAERVLVLRGEVKGNQEWIEELRRQTNDPEGEYAAAEKDLVRVDGQFKAARDALREAEGKQAADQATALREQIDRLQRARDRAKKRLDLNIEQRRLINEQIETLQQVIDRDQKRIAELTGPGSAAEEKPGADSPRPPALPASKDQELTQADHEIAERANRLGAAEREAQNIEERIANQDKLIDRERKLREIARELGEVAEEARQEYSKEFREGSVRGAPAGAQQQLQEGIDDAEARARRASEEVKRHTSRLDRLQEGRVGGLRSLALASADVERTRAALQEARSRVEGLRNPFATRNLKQWLLDHGPKLLAIGLGWLALYWLVRVLSARLARLIVNRTRLGTEAEREDRAQTLVGVFRGPSTLAIAVGGVLMALQEVGIPVIPLLGGAAVIGLAVAFGAQNLIRDFFYGFMILLENQYKLKDVVRIGDHAGQVELVTLRLTVLRDEEGNCHFIPNGEVKSVVNMTHGWSRALFDIPVASQEDMDRVMEVVQELAAELRQDEKFGRMFLDDLEMLGVDALADATVRLKFFIKTKPLKQWEVKREVLRRIKKRFDELGICYLNRREVVVHGGGVTGPIHSAGVAE